jgi:hypothetical protein
VPSVWHARRPSHRLITATSLGVGGGGNVGRRLAITLQAVSLPILAASAVLGGSLLLLGLLLSLCSASGCSRKDGRAAIGSKYHI